MTDPEIQEHIDYLYQFGITPLIYSKYYYAKAHQDGKI